MFCNWLFQDLGLDFKKLLDERRYSPTQAFLSAPYQGAFSTNTGIRISEVNARVQAFRQIRKAQRPLIHSKDWGPKGHLNLKIATLLQLPFCANLAIYSSGNTFSDQMILTPAKR